MGERVDEGVEGEKLDKGSRGSQQRGNTVLLPPGSLLTSGLGGFSPVLPDPGSEVIGSWI